MDFAAECVGAVVQEGEIYFFEEDCPVGIPGHLHICIKHAGRILIFTTCSSQIDTSIRLAKVNGWNQNTYPIFTPDCTNKFDKPTYIDCNKVWIFSEKDFGDLVKAGKIHLDIKGGIIDDMGIKRIANGVKLSTQIEDETKSLF